ncbi:MAG: GTP-binding protein [Myxococcota bacterium]
MATTTPTESTESTPRRMAMSSPRTPPPAPTAGRRDDIELLRFATAGSVDDGKSTLIGRLLYDTKALFDDQLEDLARHEDLARLTDGLRAERDQGITIDVAYRYFSTPARRFVIADCPGHREYTRNAITGFSQSDVAVLLVDARHGVVEQTRRHALLAAHFGGPRLVFCVNKMDLVDYDETVFRRVEADLRALAERLPGVGSEIDVWPISAKTGDQVVRRSPRQMWFSGPSLLDHLERIPLRAPPLPPPPARFAVQLPLRPAEDAAGRRYAGKLLRGRLAIGDAVTVLPSGQRSTVASLDRFGRALTAAEAPRDITLQLADPVDVGRGDILAGGPAPTGLRRTTAVVSWLSDRETSLPRTLTLKHLARRIRCRLRAVVHRIDIDTLAAVADGAPVLRPNDVARVRIELAASLPAEVATRAEPLARFILIDPQSYETVGAGFFAPDDASTGEAHPT